MVAGKGCWCSVCVHLQRKEYWRTKWGVSMKVVAQHFDIVEVLFVVVKMEKKAFAVLSGAFGESLCWEEFNFI